MRAPYENPVAQIVADIETARTWDSHANDTPVAAAVERMAADYKSLSDDFAVYIDDVRMIETMCRDALARHGGDLDYPSSVVGLVRLCLELWQPGDDRLD